LVALGIKLRQDEFGVSQGLGTTKTDEAHFGATMRGNNNFGHIRILNFARASAFDAKNTQHLVGLFLHLLLHF